MASSLILCQKVTVVKMASSLTASLWSVNFSKISSTRHFLTITRPHINQSHKSKFLNRQCGLHTGITCRTSLQHSYVFMLLKRHRILLSSLLRLVKPTSIRRLAWLPGLSFLEKFRRNEHELSPEILANIPREVLRKDKPKKKKKRSFFMRILLSIWESVRFTLRLARILITFIPLGVIYPVVGMNDKLKYLYWRILYHTMESLGATFIKLGQWAGSRRDLFSAEFCDMFSCLHVRTIVHPWRVSKRKLRKAFGKRWREILVRVHKKPIGSGCVAQVHKAYMPADMIPDEALVDEILEDIDDDPEIDFADGLEIIGLGNRDDDQDDGSDDIDDDQPSVPRITTPAFFLPPNPVNTDENDPDSPDGLQETGEDDDISEAHVVNDNTTGNPLEENEDDEPQLVPVAVKVLHPGVYHTVHRDLRILSTLVWFMEKLYPKLRWFSLSECMTEFTEVLLRQIDLRMEAECLEEFNQNFSDHQNIHFPKPIWPYCKRSVLVQTFEEGEPITNLLVNESITGSEIPIGLKEKLASFGVDALLQMIFVDNFVHGDLHPGNILVQNLKDYVPQDDNKLMLVDVGDTVIVNVKPTDCPVKLVLVDVGMTASLSEKDRANFRSVFSAVVVGDGAVAAELMLQHARYHNCKDIEGFKKELGDIITEARSHTISLGQIQVGKLLSDVFCVLSKHKVKVESNFASILLAIFVLEGLGRSLDPELDILEKAKPILLGQ